MLRHRNTVVMTVLAVLIVIGACLADVGAGNPALRLALLGARGAQDSAAPPAGGLDVLTGDEGHDGSDLQ